MNSVTTTIHLRNSHKTFWSLKFMHRISKKAILLKYISLSIKSLEIFLLLLYTVIYCIQLTCSQKEFKSYVSLVETLILFSELNNVFLLLHHLSMFSFSLLESYNLSTGYSNLTQVLICYLRIKVFAQQESLYDFFATIY